MGPGGSPQVAEQAIRPGHTACGAAGRRNTPLLPPAAPLHWHNVLTGEALTALTPPAQGLSLVQIFQHMLVALLTNSPAQATDAA